MIGRFATTTRLSLLVRLILEMVAKELAELHSSAQMCTGVKIRVTPD
jgi:hypothetical protein